MRLDFNTDSNTDFNTDTVKNDLCEKDSSIKPDIYEIEKYLEWAGVKLLCLYVKSDKPNIKTSSWPEFKPEFIPEQFSKLSLKPSTPNGFEIDTLDLILNLINTVSDIQIRRIIRSRTLLHPISQIHLYSWDKIATLLSISGKTCKSRYMSGLNQIKTKTNINDWIKLESRMSQIL